MPLLQDFPTKNPGGNTAPRDPSAYFPLTRDNIRTNLPLLLRQFLTYDFQHLQSFKSIPAQLYTPDARFQYPLAELDGRDAITAFWTLFLIGRAVQLNNVHALHNDMVWDPERLQAVVQMQVWQHYLPFAWLDRLFHQPAWKVWTTQVMQFVEWPADGPGALRLAFQEELQDQFVFFGLIPFGLYALRTDPGTPLHSIRTALRRLAGQGVKMWAGVLEGALQAVGWMPAQ